MKRINVSDMIYDRIIEEFLNDNINFGDKFVELEYAEKLKVSRTPLREAIKKLEHEGLILRLPNGRLKFLEITKEDVIEIFSVRIALENMLLENCIGDDAVLNTLHDNIILTDKYLKNNEHELAREQVKNFTKILYSIFNFNYAIKMLRKNNILLTKLKKRTLTPLERIIQASNEHIEIYNALINNDIETACKLNRAHLTGARDIILANM